MRTPSLILFVSPLLLNLTAALPVDPDSSILQVRQEHTVNLVPVSKRSADASIAYDHEKRGLVGRSSKTTPLNLLGGGRQKGNGAGRGSNNNNNGGGGRPKPRPKPTPEQKKAKQEQLAASTSQAKKETDDTKKALQSGDGSNSVAKSNPEAVDAAKKQQEDNRKNLPPDQQNPNRPRRDDEEGPDWPTRALLASTDDKYKGTELQRTDFQKAWARYSKPAMATDGLGYAKWKDIAKGFQDCMGVSKPPLGKDKFLFWSAGGVPGFSGLIAAYASEKNMLRIADAASECKRRKTGLYSMGGPPVDKLLPGQKLNRGQNMVEALIPIVQDRLKREWDASRPKDTKGKAKKKTYKAPYPSKVQIEDYATRMLYDFYWAHMSAGYALAATGNVVYLHPDGLANDDERHWNKFERPQLKKRLGKAVTEINDVAYPPDCQLDRTSRPAKIPDSCHQRAKITKLDDNALGSDNLPDLDGLESGFDSLP